MKAITVQQPWAWAIIHGGKDIENRSRIGTWRPARGQRVAIHASQRWSDTGAHSGLIWEALAEIGWTAGPRALKDDPRGLLTFGAIIGTATVAGVHSARSCCRPWGEAGVTHLVLADPVPVEPIPCRGALGLWTVPDDIAARLA
jgi:hypothetical protein